MAGWQNSRFVPTSYHSLSSSPCPSWLFVLRRSIQASVGFSVVIEKRRERSPSSPRKEKEKKAGTNKPDQAMDLHQCSSSWKTAKRRHHSSCPAERKNVCGAASCAKHHVPRKRTGRCILAACCLVALTVSRSCGAFQSIQQNRSTAQQHPPRTSRSRLSPASSSSSTCLTAGATTRGGSSSSSPTPTERLVISRKKKNNGKSSKKRTAGFALEKAMLNHTLLTKSEEKDLAETLQRARRLQLELDALLMVRQEQQQSEESGTVETSTMLEFLEEPQQNGRDLSDLLRTDLDGYNLLEGEEYVAHISVYNSREYDDDDDDTAQAMDGILSSKTVLLEEHEGKSLLLGDEEDDDDELLPVGDSTSSQRSSNGDGTPPPRNRRQQQYDDDLAQQLGLSDAAELHSILYQGAQARDILIRRNLKLVFSICKQWARNYGDNGNTDQSVYRGSWNRPSLSEAIQEGCIGLIQAVERFDPSRNLRLSTYATYYITNQVRRCYQHTSSGVLRLPIGYYDTRTRFQRLVKEYHDKQGATPGLDEMAAELNVTERRLRRILRMTKAPLSTDAPSRTSISSTGTQSTEQLTDTIMDETEMNPEDRIELSLLRQSLEDAMATELAPFERDVLRLRLGLDDGATRSRKEVVAACGGRVSLSEVSSTERQALKKLRSPVALATYKLMAYLDFAGVDRESIKLI